MSALQDHTDGAKATGNAGNRARLPQLFNVSVGGRRNSETHVAHVQHRASFQEHVREWRARLPRISVRYAVNFITGRLF